MTHAERSHSRRRPGDAASAAATRARSSSTAARSSIARSPSCRRVTDDILMVGASAATATSAGRGRARRRPRAWLRPARRARRGACRRARRRGASSSPATCRSSPRRSLAHLLVARARRRRRRAADRTRLSSAVRGLHARLPRRGRARGSADRRLKMRELLEEVRVRVVTADEIDRFGDRRSAARQREHAGRVRRPRGASGHKP